MRRLVQKNIRKAHWEHVNNILEESLTSGNSKPFWRYVKAKKKDDIGVAGPKDNGTLHDDPKVKAGLLNNQFSSVYTKDDKDAPLPNIEHATKYPSISNITVDEKGVLNLLTKLNTNKASGPDGISNRFLKARASEITPSSPRFSK